MEAVTITKEQLGNFVLAAKHYLNNHAAKKSILWINLNEILPYAIKRLKKVERERDLVRMKFCKKTASKHIEFDKRGHYQFTEKDNLEVLKEFDRIDEETVELPCRITPAGEYPQSGITYDTRQAFLGIVLPADEYKLKEGVEEELETENARVQMELEEEEEQAVTAEDDN